jgi:phage N-6-adenine-methyltransferase
LDQTEYCTPPRLYQKLNEEFRFTLDPASTDKNHLAPRWFTKLDNGLRQPWNNESVFVNPPYGRGLTDKWVKKAYFAARRHCATVVLLLPVKADTDWFHRYIMRANEIRFIRGRVSHFDDQGKQTDTGFFASMIVVFRPFETAHGPIFSSYRWRKVHARTRRKPNVLSN